MKRKFSFVAVIFLLMSLVFVGCGTNKNTNEQGKENEKGFKYYTAEQLKNSIENEESLKIVDIQVEEEFKKHHIKGVIATYAYPVKSDEEKAKLDNILDELKDSEDNIVIVCPGGKGGAERTYKHLLEKEIDESRLFILENGQSGWPYEELLEKNN